MPKNTDPPKAIAVVRGTHPEKSAAGPSFRRIPKSRGGKDNTEGEAECAALASSITRVLTTSSGVVETAATAPAKDPHTAASVGEGRRPSSRCSDMSDLRPSYRGNWIEVKGNCLSVKPVLMTHFSGNGDPEASVKASQSILSCCHHRRV